MVGTILKNPPVGFENRFAGNFNDVPEDRIAVGIYSGGLIVPEWNGSIWIEAATTEEIQALNLQKAIQIDLEYKDRITKLLTIPIQKVNCRELEEVPADILAEKELLKTECNEKIIALGITDFSFRKKVTLTNKL